MLAPLLLLLEKARLYLVNAEQQTVGPDQYCRLTVAGEDDAQEFLDRLTELNELSDFTIQLPASSPLSIAWIWEASCELLPSLLERYPPSTQGRLQSQFLVSSSSQAIAMSEAAAVPAFEGQALVQAETKRANLDLVLQRYKPAIICEVVGTHHSDQAITYSIPNSTAWRLSVPVPFIVRNPLLEDSNRSLGRQWSCAQIDLHTQRSVYVLDQICQPQTQSDKSTFYAELQANMLVQGLDKVANNRIIRHHNTVVVF